MIQNINESEDSDDYLLEVISLHGDEEFKAEAEVAFKKLYTRHYREMLYVALRFTKANVKDAEDLTHDTFIKVFQKAGEFTLDKSTDKSDIKYAIQKWMVSIMRNHFIDSMRKSLIEETTDNPEESEHIIKTFNVLEPRFNNEVDEDDVINGHIDTDFSFNEKNQVESEAFSHQGTASDNLAVIQDYLDTLPPDHAYIIRMNYLYYSKGKYRPKEVLNLLTSSTGKTKDYIRKIISRVTTAIREKLQSKINFRA